MLNPTLLFKIPRSKVTIMKNRIKKKGQQIDSYLYKLLLKVRQLAIKLTVGGNINFGETTMKKILRDDTGFYEKVIFSDLHEAYLEPFGYKSWEDFSHKELEIKSMLDLKKITEWDLIIETRVTQLEGNYYKENTKVGINEKHELARKFYDKSFINEKLYNYEDAIKKMEYAIKLFPENTIYFLRIAELFHLKGDIFQCMEYLGNITTNSYDITFPIIVRHNTALALRSIGFKEPNPAIRKELLLTSKNELEDIYLNQIGSNPTLNIITLKFKVGINYCHTLLDNHDLKSAGGIYGELQMLSQNVGQIDDELRLRLDMILCILESNKNVEEGDKLFEKLYDSFIQNSNDSKNYEFLSEITSCWAAYYKNDTDRQIVILEKSFLDEIWGQWSDIEYKNMLRLSDLYEHKKQYQDATKYLKEVFKYSYLGAELKETIEKKVRFFEKMIAQG